MARAIQAVQFHCKSCNSILHISTNSPILQCPCCGSTELILENDNITIERIKSQTTLEHQKVSNDLELNKMLHKERESKLQADTNHKGFIAILVFLAFFFSIPLLINFDFENLFDSFTDKIHAPLSTYDCKKETYQTVQMYFSDAGFASVTSRAIIAPKDVDTEKIGYVKDIMIDGDTDFYSSDKFSPDAKVVIYYYSLTPDANYSQ